MTKETDSAGQHDLVFFANRNTPLVVPKGGSTDGKVKKGYGAQTSRRAAKPEEEKVIAGGGWLQVNNKGKKPGQSGYKPGSNYRPQLRDKSEQDSNIRDVDILLIDEFVSEDDNANIPSVQTGPNQIYAAIRSDAVRNSSGSANAPSYRKIIKIERDGDGKTVSTVVQDYKLDSALNSIIDDAMLDVAQELADDDDTPEEQRLLMSAWQALAIYLASCDDEDRNAAASALKVVSDLMAGGGSTTSPMPDGTFGKTVQTAASTTYSCAKCDRSFGTMNGLIGHLQNLHNMDSFSARKAAVKANGDVK